MTSHGHASVDRYAPSTATATATTFRRRRHRRRRCRHGMEFFEYLPDLTRQFPRGFHDEDGRCGSIDCGGRSGSSSREAIIPIASTSSPTAVVSLLLEVALLLLPLFLDLFLVQEGQ